MSRTATPTAQDFVPFATAALDFHRTLNVPGGPLVTTRAELDTLHAHLISLHGLFDAHTARTGQLVPIEGNQLRVARTRIWQAAEHVHTAYHAAPRTESGEIPDREACRARVPEGAPELTICQRHQRTAHLVRRQTTPADLQAPFTGLVRY
ncbi:DUF6238 family protein [Streptomyces fildesensis]|uniref:DUF6238 family protein n=1 Tax=Streptomyces fildesensis TaxID=375757 RepID=UPI0018DF7F12|nr:DUF6238 family protein [Streptomyces fildesensis]